MRVLGGLLHFGLGKGLERAAHALDDKGGAGGKNGHNRRSKGTKVEHNKRRGRGPRVAGFDPGRATVGEQGPREDAKVGEEEEAGAGGRGCEPVRWYPVARKRMEGRRGALDEKDEPGRARQGARKRNERKRMVSARWEIDRE